MAKKKQSTEDCISRVRCMAVDTAGLWLLSDKDREALQHVLSERESMAAELASLQSEIERLRGTLDGTSQTTSRRLSMTDHLESFESALSRWNSGSYSLAERDVPESHQRRLRDAEIIANRVAGFTPSAGVELIGAERERQVSHCGWSAEHDDEQHGDSSLAACAAILAGGDIPYLKVAFVGFEPYPEWVLERLQHIRSKYAGDKVRQLVIAGALIAAEIDRIQRENAEYPERTVAGT